MAEVIEQDAYDFVRWDVLHNLAGRLSELADQVYSLADDVTPDRLTVIDAPENAKIIRQYFDALDEIGWCSESSRREAVAA